MSTGCPRMTTVGTAAARASGLPGAGQFRVSRTLAWSGLASRAIRSGTWSGPTCAPFSIIRLTVLVQNAPSLSTFRQMRSTE